MFNEQLLLLETYTNPTNDSIRHLIDLFKSYKSQRSKGKDRYKNESAFADAYKTRQKCTKSIEKSYAERINVMMRSGTSTIDYHARLNAQKIK